MISWEEDVIWAWEALRRARFSWRVSFWAEEMDRSVVNLWR